MLNFHNLEYNQGFSFGTRLFIEKLTHINIKLSEEQCKELVNYYLCEYPDIAQALINWKNK